MAGEEYFPGTRHIMQEAFAVNVKVVNPEYMEWLEERVAELEQDMRWAKLALEAHARKLGLLDDRDSVRWIDRRAE